MSFGSGQRRCLARSFVLLFTVLTLATLALRWRPRPLSGSLETEVFPFLRPKGGLQVRLERRAGAPS
jgi:cytochrome P450